MKTIEYYDILFEREDTATATATSETDVKQGTVNKFVYYDDTKREVISDGRGGWYILKEAIQQTHQNI